MTSRSREALLVHCAVSYSSSLHKNAFYLLKQSSNDSRLLEKGLPVHSVSFGTPLLTPQVTRTPVKLSFFLTQSTNAKILEGLSLSRHYAHYIVLIKIKAII